MVLLGTAVGTAGLVLWGVKSLPPSRRGKEVITTGAFRFFRHPLYAAFLSCFNFGLAVFLNNWIYVAWAFVVHILWHVNIVSEEKLMIREFPGRYEEYCKMTGRFVPRLGGWQHNKPIQPTR